MTDAAKTAQNSEKFRESYKRYQGQLETTFQKFPESLEEFDSVSVEKQLELMRVSSSFSTSDFRAYFILMKRLDFPKPSVMGDWNVGYKTLYKKMSKNTELKCLSTEIDKILMENIKSIFGVGMFSYTSNRGLITLTYVLRGMYSEVALREYVDRFYTEASDSSIIDLVNVLPHWETVKDYPLSWSIKLYSTCQK